MCKKQDVICLPTRRNKMKTTLVGSEKVFLI